MPSTDTLRRWLYTAFVLLYMGNLFIGSAPLTVVTGIVAMACLPISYPGATRTFRVVSVAFLGIGLGLLVASGTPWTRIPGHFTSTGLMLALLYMLPWINNLIIVGRYEQHLGRLLKNGTDHPGKLYRRTSLVSYVLCIFLFFASIPLVYRVLRKQLTRLPEAVRNRFAAESVLRAFAMATVWSPVEVFIVVVSSITGVAYPEFLPWLLLFSGTMIGVDWLLAVRHRKHELQPRSGASAGEPVRLGKLFQLIAALAVLIGTSIALSRWLAIDFFAAVTLLILPYCLVWALLIHRGRAYWKYSLLAWKKQVPELNNLALLFLSLGFFNRMVEETAVLEFLRGPLVSLAETPVILFVLIQLSSVLLALVGFHPLVTLGLQGVLLQPLLDTIDPLSLAVLLLTANIASDASGTYNTTVALMSQLTGEPPYRITRWNIGFALLYSSVGTALALLLL
ncbi:hypothetical protein C8P63_1516 [Melghirimyces profundicolus]|uniref:Na+/H+ antiporter NhaD/arsenite permease-like protein n=1 Tax=Melghirimyces profundicolus TaxID=1242148 RepID=A0A2T6AUK6_9BACL|nr:hypothetical protein [Melghirimyces profundicolus]PTX47509.1 hypothetical protein C8P63_1516 [Melghirimyces profundicolus]